MQVVRYEKYGKLFQERKQMPEMNSVVKPISSCISLTVALPRTAVDWHDEFHYPQHEIAPYVYRKACPMMDRRVRQQALELLEPLTLKGVRAALRRGGGGNATFLPDLRGAGWCFGCGAEFTGRLVSGWFGVRRGRFDKHCSDRQQHPTPT
jgi:hypothetical protein